MIDKSENMRMLGSHRYLVWTQAGFVKACKNINNLIEELDCPVEGFPTVYPSFVVFSGGYSGYHHWVATCTPLSKAISNTKLQLEFLEQADREHNSTLTKDCWCSGSRNCGMKCHPDNI